MDTDDSSNKGRFGSDDDLKSLYHDYLAEDEESLLNYTYSGNFKPKTLKKKVSSSLGLIPEKDLALPSLEATTLNWNHLRTFYYVAKAGRIYQGRDLSLCHPIRHQPQYPTLGKASG